MDKVVMGVGITMKNDQCHGTLGTETCSEHLGAALLAPICQSSILRINILQQFNESFPSFLRGRIRAVDLLVDMRVLIPSSSLPIIADKSENSPTLFSPFRSEVQDAPNMSLKEKKEKD